MYDVLEIVKLEKISWISFRDNKYALYMFGNVEGYGYIINYASFFDVRWGIYLKRMVQPQ